MLFDFIAAKDRYEQWLRNREANIIKHTGPLWDAEKDMLQEVRTLGLGMLKHYALWSVTVDYRYTLLSTEQLCSIPLPTVEMGNSWSPDLDYVGRFDGIVRNIYNGNFYVLEFKTTKSLTRMSGTFRGMQPTAYVWAAGQHYGVPMRGVLYRCLRKRVPDNPTPLKTAGHFSRAKSQQLTGEWFLYYITAWAKAQGVSLADVLAINEPVVSMLKSKENEFFLEQPIARNDSQIKECIDALIYEGTQMADPRTPAYPLSGIHCGWCAFKEPCDLMSEGMDPQFLLDSEYASRDYWEQDDD